MTFETDVFSRFDRQWALLCAGTPEDFNAMTISWGGMGTLWGKSVVTVYVKPIRYTWRYLEANDRFTVSFFPEAYWRDLSVMGTRSGRDGDKLAFTRLTPCALDGAVGFDQAETTILCRKIYWQDLVRQNMPADVAAAYYAAEEPHRMYIGEVLSILPERV